MGVTQVDICYQWLLGCPHQVTEVTPPPVHMEAIDSSSRNDRQEQMKGLLYYVHSASSLVKTKYEIKPNSHHNEIVRMCVYTMFVESIEVVDFMMFIMKKQPTVFTSSCE